ncbi:mitochondrial carrier homolog 1 isoform X2 [Ambystoma mexicanum]|uniref:mitochondrial carrier homolog 1 isoform X2 n=1 Tax=Ambystoma mexicanum TaxID=8296 RepID=UPI0037E8FD44
MAAKQVAPVMRQEDPERSAFEANDSLYLLLGAGAATLTHPLIYVKLLVQVGHEPLPATYGRNILGNRVLYLPGFFTYARYIVQVDGKRGLFRGLTPSIVSSTLNTASRITLKKTSNEMMVQCLSRIIAHPLHVVSMRCMVQFVGREVQYSGVFGSIANIYKEDGILGFFQGLVPHLLGDAFLLWCCSFLSHFINTYAVDDNFTHASIIRSYTKFVLGVALSMLSYPFMLVGDLMAINNCGLIAGIPPYSPVYTSWIQCWRHLSATGQLFRGSSLFYRRVPSQISLPMK